MQEHIQVVSDGKGDDFSCSILTKIQRMDIQGIASHDVTNSGDEYALVRTLDEQRVKSPSSGAPFLLPPNSSHWIERTFLSKDMNRGYEIGGSA